VKIKWPSGPALVAVLFLVLLPALAVLQYNWVGQVSVAERERMQRNLINAADQFDQTFESEIVRALISLQIGAQTARDGASDQYSRGYTSWISQADYPQIVAGVHLVDAEAGKLRLRRWNAESHVFEPSLWPASLERWRPHFEYALTEFRANRLPEVGHLFSGEESLVAMPIRQGGGRQPGARPAVPLPEPVFGFTILELDLPYLRNQMIPTLVERHFVLVGGDSYRVAVTAGDDPTRALYRSEQGTTIDLATADATAALVPFTAGFLFRNTPGLDRNTAGIGRVDGRRREGNEASNEAATPARWRLLVQHQSGSLEAAVGTVRRRNLALSFGVLLMLTVSVVMLMRTTRRSERLAQQQMEFVAGVSHELRTPVAVIRSASENLASGVVSGDRVKKYGQMLEAEARRLSEMVERVLQYAGIESGLGFGARVALSSTELIESAVESAIPLVGPGDVQVQRDIAPDLPPVMGDAAALRSALQNVIANAVKYGGRDRWVGIRAQHVRERRKSEVRITVSDHGAGIPAADLPHIFEPFFRGADALERQVHGNGLGLALVRRIVTAHGGKVTVMTRPGGGSAFTITLPAAAADASANRVASEMQVGAHS
jgi:signal transduction histidine kinase